MNHVMVFATDAGIADPLAYHARLLADTNVGTYETTALLAVAMEQTPSAVVVLWSGSILPVSVAVKDFRRASLTNPIFVLVRDESYKSRVHLLVNGADDVQSAPIDPQEFVARLHALRRREREREQNEIALPNEARFLIETGELLSPLGKSRVPYTEAKILIALAARPGTVMTKEMLMTALYGGQEAAGLKIIDVFVCKLRKRIEAATGGLCCIETMWGRGYVWRSEGYRPVFTEARHRAQAGAA